MNCHRCDKQHRNCYDKEQTNKKKHIFFSSNIADIHSKHNKNYAECKRYKKNIKLQKNQNQNKKKICKNKVFLFAYFSAYRNKRGREKKNEQAIKAKCIYSLLNINNKCFKK